MWRSRLPCRIAPLALGFVLVAAPGAALAQPATPEMKAGARAAAEQGNTAYKEGRYTDALDLFNRAETLFKAPTHQLMIARTHIALGQLVAAQDVYRKMTVEQLPPSAPQPFKAAQKEAQKELADLETRIPLVKVTVSDPNAKGLAVVKDGKGLPPALVGIPHPANPGKHTFQATADGLQSEVVTITLKEREKANVSLELRPVQRQPAAGDSATPAATEPDRAGMSTGRILSYTAIGVGVAGIGVGVTLVALGLAKRGEADDLEVVCNGCLRSSPEGQAVVKADDDATLKSSIGVAALIAGGVIAAGGVTLLIVTGKKAAPPAAFHLGGEGNAGVKVTPGSAPKAPA